MGEFLNLQVFSSFSPITLSPSGDARADDFFGWGVMEHRVSNLEEDAVLA